MAYARPALCANVAGAADIWVTTQVGGGNALSYGFLGNTVNGIQVAETPYFVPVHSDVNGGEQGPPVDYQLLGRQGYLEMELVQYDDAILSKIEECYRKANGSGSAVNRSAGMLLGCAAASFDVVIIAANWTRHYLSCIPLEPIRKNIGAIHTRASLAFTCNEIGGVLYDSVTDLYTGIPT